MQLVSINVNLKDQLRQQVDAHYRIGEIESIEGLADGCCNLNFLIRIRRAGKLYAYILRRYHPDRTAEQIRFEHSFIHHVRQNNFTLAAGVISCRDGKTWLREPNL